MKNPSSVETVASSPITKAGLAVVATVAGTPLAALLPVLADTLAARRHEARVVGALSEIEKTIQAHGEAIERLTDPQYRLLNELALTVLQTTEPEKIEILKQAVRNGLRIEGLSQTHAAQMARALRDMTAGELNFLLANDVEKILIGPLGGVCDGLVVNRRSIEMTYFTGLVGLGIIVPAGSGIDDGGVYAFAPVCTELRRLLNE